MLLIFGNGDRTKIKLKHARGQANKLRKICSYVKQQKIEEKLFTEINQIFSKINFAFFQIVSLQ